MSAYHDLMNLLDLSFGFSTPETQFLGLLPKLYREEKHPERYNAVVCENGVPVAAVGAYDHAITVAGIRLSCRGIGNVAVHPDHRGKGYMKDCMHEALDSMIRDGIDLSSLGGRRQRYRYFSYDKAGPCHTFVFTADNIRHTFGTLDAPMTALEITDSHDPLLPAIKALSDAASVSPERALEDYLAIAQTWHARLYAILDGERLAGAAIVEPNGFVTEVHTATDADILPLLRTIFAALGRGSITLRLPPYECAKLAAVAPVAEGVQTGASMSYTVLCYERVIRAFLTLKTSYEPLPDGSLTLLIHGFAGDERLHIRIQNGQPSVEKAPVGSNPDYEMAHLEAISILFSAFSPMRDALSPLLRSWFPLPIWIYRADEV